MTAARQQSPIETLVQEGLALQRRGKIDEAVALFTAVLEQDPHQPDALHLLGIQAYQAGVWDKAAAMLEQAVAARPNAADFVGNLGTVYLGQKRLEAAKDCYEKAISLQPKNMGNRVNLAVVLGQLKRHQEAIALAQQVIKEQPDHLPAYNALGNNLRQIGQYDMAEKAFYQLILRAPQDPESYYNYGVVLQDLWRMQEAKESYDKAIALKDNVARYYVNHGAALMKLHAIEQAGESYKKALELEPNLAEAHYNYAICQFLLGHMSEGARHYDWRLKIDETSLSRPRDMDVPLWDGTPDPHKTILLHSEQGLGDMIQFIRFAPAVAMMMGKVLVEVQKPLVQLFRDSFPMLTFFAKGAEVPEHHVHAPLMSLMGCLKLELDDLPASPVPYLTAQPARCAQWQAHIARKGDEKIIAIAWQGNPKAKVDRGRSIPLKMLEPLLSLPNTRFISLQKNEGSEQLDALPPALRARIETLGDGYDASPDGAFLDTVAVMKQCDLIITTDTALAHIAGGLNCPTYLMLKKTPDWRWMLQREDSPWYPSTRLFRQKEEDNWAAVVAQIMYALAPDNILSAISLHQCGETTLAETAYRDLISKNISTADAQHYLGVIAYQRGQADVAESYIREALAAQPHNADMLANLALTQKAQGQIDAAISTAEKSLKYNPRQSSTHNNIGNCYKIQGRLKEAVAHYKLAVQCDPQNPSLLHNLGLGLIDQGDLAAAEKPLRQAVALAPKNADYHFDLARCLLMQGTWAEGWKEYEWRRLMPEFGKVSPPAAPQWTGVANANLTLLIHAEQGLGDAIQFGRYVMAAKARVGKVLLVVPPRLKALFASLDGCDALYVYGEALPPYHAHAPLLSLPHIMGTAGLFATPRPYLRADDTRRARWKAWRAQFKGRVIGLNWQGNPNARADAGRSIALKNLRALAAVEDVTFVALQRGEALDQVADLPAGFPLIVPPAPFDEDGAAFLDTAALMQELDLVLTTDTSVAHLAGALGVPCWVMLKHIPDWRWMLARSDSPWYAHTRLFRQPIAGDWESVVHAVKRALQNPTVKIETGLTLHQQGKFAEAQSIYEAVLAAAPQDVQALHYLGVVHYQQGRAAQAEPLIREALSLNPAYAEAWGNLALSLKAQDKMEEAEAAFQHALKLNDKNADVYNNYGNLLSGLKRYDEALASYQAAAKLQPHRIDAYQNMGNTLNEQKRYSDAIEQFRRALAMKPDSISALNGLGKAYRQSEQIDAAIAVFKEATRFDPHNADAWSNLGVCHREQDNYSEALTCYDEALKLKPDYAEAWSNRAIALHYSQQFSAAEEAYRKSIHYRPQRADTHFGLSTILLSCGQWAEGWQEYEWRRLMEEFAPLRQFKAPEWQGQAAPDKTLFIYAEQGLGDSIQFMRFIKAAQAKVGKVVFEVQGGLRRLFTPYLEGVEMIAQGDALPAYDYTAPLLSLPRLLGITLETLPAPTAYLHAEKNLVQAWAKKLPKKAKGQLRVGINWQGNPKAAIDKGRSVPLLKLKPVIEQSTAQFVVLQKNAGLEQINALPPKLQKKLHELGAEFDAGKDAFLDSAAVMVNCDLILTSDTAIAHLAGALGVPCWVMLKHIPDWRWMNERTDTPFYSQTRLFRQPVAGDWDAVAQAVLQALNES